MRIRCASLVILALSLSALVGCSSGKGGPQSPPTNPEPPPPQPKPKPKVEPEPEVEPVPGEAVKLKLPKDNGAWPWSVGKADPPPESRPVLFTALPMYTVTGFAARPEAHRAALSIRAEPKKGQPGAHTRLVLCDTATGQSLRTEWHVPGLYTILDLSPDGRSVLVTHPQSGKERTVLRMWAVGADGQLKRWSCTPHTPTREGLRQDSVAKGDPGSIEVRWAAFVGERVVSVSRAGQLRVFDPEGLKPLATIDASPARPAVTPDGTKVAFLVGSSVALLDPQALKVTGVRWVGQPPPQPVLAFSPDGTRLAIGGNGEFILLNLTSGQLQSKALPKLDVNDNGTYDKPFGWAGAAHLFADRSLFDPQLPAPVWDYTGVEFIQFRGWQAWAVVREAGKSNAAVRAFTLPGPDTLSALSAAKSKPGVFGLQPGGGVKIDVGGLPEDRRAEVQKMLDQRLRDIGFTPDANAAVALVASVDSPGTKPTVVYSGIGSYQYTKKSARLRLVLGGKELWNDAWAVEPPLSVDIQKGANLADYLSRLEMGGPDYTVFGIAPIPSHFPGPNAPAAPLGSTDLAANKP